jgi:FkbM family methyltransferase
MTRRIYIQIGTNDGNDLFRQMCMHSPRPTHIILIEPNTSLIPSIRHNYEGIDNVTIVNKAIYHTSGLHVELCIPAHQGRYGSQASNGCVYTHVNFSLVPMNDWGNTTDMVKIMAETITFDQLCSDYDMTEIEYLQIDTEGYDSEIIRMLDLSKYSIKRIRYEQWGFNPKEFSRLGEVASRLGSAGMDFVKDKLENAGYTLSPLCDSDGNDMLAVKGT